MQGRACAAAVVGAAMWALQHSETGPAGCRSADQRGRRAEAAAGQGTAGVEGAGAGDGSGVAGGGRPEPRRARLQAHRPPPATQPLVQMARPSRSPGAPSRRSAWTLS